MSSTESMKHRVANVVLSERALGLFLPVATVLLLAYFAMASPYFLTPGNFRDVLLQNAATLVIVVPCALLLMSGAVDLSVGSVLALAGVTAGLVWKDDGNVLLGVVLALIVGVAVGLFNGVLVSWMGFSPIVVTLGTLAICRGAAQVIAPDAVFGFPESVIEFGAGSFLGIPYLVWIALVVILAGMIVLNKLPAGRHIVSLGVNAKAAFLIGLPVKKIGLSLFVASGLAAAVAGIMLSARFASAPSGSLGVGLELAVLTAILLGGVPFQGGPGAIWRVVLGVLLLGFLRNGMTILNVTPEASLIVTGSVLIAAAGLEILRARLFRAR